MLGMPVGFVRNRRGAPTVQALEIRWNNISNVPVADASSVSDWNTFFDLPTNGTPFTSVEVVGNLVKSYGGSSITLKLGLFEVQPIVSFIDNSGCIIGGESYCFNDCHLLQSVGLKAALNIGINFFVNCSLVTEYNLESCTNLGGTVGDDNVFQGINGQTITLKVPAALMTCNSGAPDGDIQTLQVNNTVTVITV